MKLPFRAVLTIAIGLILVAPGQALSAGRFTLDLYGGTAWNAPTPLTIEQQGQPPIHVDWASYETKPFFEAPYYAYRFGWKDIDLKGAWELELIHHKLYLTSPPANVQHFEVSHGYNLILVSRSRLTRTHGKLELWCRTGAGVVLAHPETTVNNKTLADPEGLDGFYLSGVGGQVSLSARYLLTRYLAISAETKLTAAWARVPVADGHADVPNVAAHVLFGITVSL